MVSDEARQFLAAFQRDARQLCTPQLAVDWWLLRRSLRAPFDGGEAAAWANLGFYPAEAEPHIAAGMTAATYREMEDHAEQRAGGGDALAAERVARMLECGELVGEADVVRIPDPVDPSQEIVVHRDDL